MHSKPYVFLFFFLGVAALTFAQQTYPLYVNDIPAQRKWVDSLYKGMTIDQKVGQLFMVDLFSSDPKEKIDKVRKLVTEQHIGGVIFSKGGPTRQAKLTNELQRSATTPLLVAMDAEWGLAMRLDSTYAFPWNLSLIHI